MSSGEVVKVGYLTKSPPEGRLGQWQRRWFVFADSHRTYPRAPRYIRMEYYHSEEDAEMFRNPKGIIDLKTCTKVSTRENMKGFKHVFDVCTSDRKYHLVAENEVDKKEWIDILKSILFGVASTTTTTTPSSSSSPSPSPVTDPSTTHHHHHQQQQPRNNRPAGFSTQNSTPSSLEGIASPLDKERRLGSPADQAAASRQNSRPLPPVPNSSINNRPLPPPPKPVSSSSSPSSSSSGTATYYKRLSAHGVPSSSSSSNCTSTSNKHKVVRQVKSSGIVTEGPDSYQLSMTPSSVNVDYENIGQENSQQQNKKAQQQQRDYVNLDADYDDTIQVDGCVYEDYIPQPTGAAPISSSFSSTAPSPLPRQTQGGPDYVNLDNSTPDPDGENYSMIEAEPNQPPSPSGDYSVLEAVHSQPIKKESGYSRLELTGNIDLTPTNRKPPPTKPRPYNSGHKGTDVDYENLAHVAHPGTGDYSYLQH